MYGQASIETETARPIIEEYDNAREMFVIDEDPSDQVQTKKQAIPQQIEEGKAPVTELSTDQLDELKKQYILKQQAKVQ